MTGIENHAEYQFYKKESIVRKYMYIRYGNHLNLQYTKEKVPREKGVNVPRSVLLLQFQEQNFGPETHIASQINVVTQVFHYLSK